jgi:hypothetical protein
MGKFVGGCRERSGANAYTGAMTRPRCIQSGLSRLAVNARTSEVVTKVNSVLDVYVLAIHEQDQVISSLSTCSRCMRGNQRTPHYSRIKRNCGRTRLTSGNSQQENFGKKMELSCPKIHARGIKSNCATYLISPRAGTGGYAAITLGAPVIASSLPPGERERLPACPSRIFFGGQASPKKRARNDMRTVSDCFVVEKHFSQ